jgi:hypothetical protein
VFPALIAVRDVEDRSRGVLLLAAAPREVRGPARAVIERVARAAEHPGELAADAAQARQLRVDLVDLGGKPDAPRLRRSTGPAREARGGSGDRPRRS